MASQSEPVLPISGEEEISVNSRGSLEDLVSYLTTENHSGRILFYLEVSCTLEFVTNVCLYLFRY